MNLLELPPSRTPPLPPPDRFDHGPGCFQIVTLCLAFGALAAVLHHYRFPLFRWLISVPPDWAYLVLGMLGLLAAAFGLLCLGAVLPGGKR